jgi:hypothetical protein
MKRTPAQLAWYQKNKERLADRRKQISEEKRNDPDSYEAVKSKWREDYRKRKESGKLKTSHERKEYDQKYRDENRERRRIQVRIKYRKYRRLVINHYGGSCACCGESNMEFLAVDHINGGGNKHRTELGRSVARHFYRWLKKHGFPDGYRVLCHNCNQSIGLYGYCPHKGKPDDPEMPLSSRTRKTPSEEWKPLGPATGLRNGSHTHPESVNRGRKNGNAKLSDSDIREIRQLSSNGMNNKTIGARFGISDVSIGNILSGKSWKHVT